MYSADNKLPKLLSYSLEAPDADKLAQILRIGLKLSFKEVTVEWVDCPDLTQEPFNLAAPGLCGSTAVVQTGGTHNLFPVPKIKKTFRFDEIVKATNREHLYSFIMGGCVRQQPWNKHIGELTTNMLFSPKSYRVKVNQQSYMAFWDVKGNKCKLEPQVFCPKYSMLGNFFVSEGKAGKVLKVQAKQRTCLEYINAMQSELNDEYPMENLKLPIIALGGTFVVNNAKVRHHILPNFCDGEFLSRNHVQDCLHYFEINAPVVAVGMFISSNKPLWKFMINNRETDVNFTRKHFQTFSRQANKGGYYHADIESSNTVEYLGYFSPAESLFSIKPTHPWYPMREFSYVSSRW